MNSHLQRSLFILSVTQQAKGLNYFGKKKSVFLGTHFEQLCCSFLALSLPNMCYEIEKLKCHPFWHFVVQIWALYRL